MSKSTLNAQAAPPPSANISFSEPPDVKLIEASCRQATRKTPDFAEWTNVLSEPLLVRKGSEIKCLSSYIDAPGIDTDIIQFTRSGVEQDNVHTFLSQMYTVNDGFQNKTTSYDYMCNRGSSNIKLINQGGDAVGITLPGLTLPNTLIYVARQMNEKNEIVGDGAEIKQITVEINTLKELQIVNGGINYNDGDLWEVKATQGNYTAAHGKIKVGALGKITGFIYEHMGGGLLAAHHEIIITNIAGATVNTSASLTATFATGYCLQLNSIQFGSESAGVLTNANFGNRLYNGGETQVWITPKDIHTPIAGYPFDTGARFYPMCMYNKNPAEQLMSASNPSYFDPGYNYQRCPLYRWSQIYENTSIFCYGRNFFRNFTADDGNNVSLVNQSQINQIDNCFSAAYLLRNKEDEFVPGFYHRNFDNQKTPGNFNIYRPTIVINNLTEASAFQMGRDLANDALFPNLGRIEVLETTKKVFLDPTLPKTVENQTTISQFWSNPLAVGMSFQIDFDFVSQQAGDRTQANLLALHNGFIAKYAGIYTVGHVSFRKSGGNTFKRLYIGPPVRYDSSGESDYGNITYKNSSAGVVTNLAMANSNGSPNTGLGPGNGIIIACETAQNPPANIGQGEKPVGVIVNINNSGVITSVYAMDPSLYGGGGNYFVGTTLKSILPGDPRIPAGWSVLPNNAANNGIRFVIQQVDNTMGCDFSTWDQLQQSQLIVNNLPVNMVITPLPFYMDGINTTSPNVNAIGLQKKHGATYFPNTNSSYPPIRENAFLLNSATNQAGKTIPLQCGLYKPNGIKRNSDVASKTNITMQHHDVNNSLQIINAAESVSPDYMINLAWTIGSSLTADHIYHVNGVLPGGTFPADTITFNFTKILAGNFGITEIWQLPNMGLLILNEGTAGERHIITSGEMSIATVASNQIHVTMKLKSLSTHANSNYPMTLPASMTDSPNAYIAASIIDGESAGPDLSGGITVTYWNKIYNMNNNAIVKLDESITGTGTVAWTSTQNFFGTEDPNYSKDTLLKSYSWNEIGSGQISTTEISAYNKGGYYYLTQANDVLTDSSINIPKFFGFSQGYGEFVLQDIDDFRTFSTHLADKVYNNKLLEDSDTLDLNPNIEYSQGNNATNIYGYEPYYQQKTFKIIRNFVVPSDIASRWNEQSHEPLGVIDRDLGTVLATPLETGLIQNEFVIPVYPSNNDIGGNGEYIRDLKQYPNSGGLMGGHMVGVGFIPKAQEFINRNMMGTLEPFVGRVSPAFDVTDKIHYKVFMRNAFTFIRNYDPQKQKALVPTSDYHYNPLPNGAPASISFPDRTAINQLQTQARNIGNFGVIEVAARNTSPKTPKVPETSKYFIDGKPTPRVYDPTSNQPKNTSTPDAPEDGYNPNVNPNSSIISEGMTIFPNTTSTHVPFQSGNSTPFPASSIGYPVRYLENNVDGEFNTAIGSQYVGTTNLTLAFQTSISAFTFQFMMQPFTSPFVDDTGGDLSTRIFYGNRKRGLFNHDSFGGITVWNYCRPNYPKGIFSLSDTIGVNSQPTAYSNGINPFRDTAVIGKRFLNKLGFDDSDLGIENNQIKGYAGLISGNNLGYNAVEYTQKIDMDRTSISLNSLDLTILGTNYSNLDSSDSILSSINAPENTAGLFANATAVTPGLSISTLDSKKNLNGDYIFYPYSFSGTTDSFNSSTSTVRYDNCTDAYGSMGGGISKNMGRGMGLPNTQGSTSIVDATSIPVTMNADCNLYLSFTVQTSSNFIKASRLPIKMNHGHLVILSSLIEDPNFIMSKAQGVNGISVVSKAYITADFILSTGFISFYAKRDRVISSITTMIKNTAFEAPTVLGDNSTIIYQITDYQPKPLDRPNTITEIQDNDYQIMAMVNEHMESVHQGTSSKLDMLESELYNLGAIVIGGGDKQNANADVISQLRAQIDATGLNQMSTVQRAQFYQTAGGQIFLQNASDAQQVMQSVRALEDQGIEQAQGFALEPEARQQIIDVVRNAQKIGRDIDARSRYTAELASGIAPILQQQIQQVQSRELKNLPFSSRRPPEGDARRISGERRAQLNDMRRQAMAYKLQAEQEHKDETGESQAETIRKSILERHSQPLETIAEEKDEN